MTKLTIVMYHYVRDLERSRYPAIKGRRITEFERQLDYIQANFSVLNAQTIASGLALSDGWMPPLWLTFDDGFIDHYTNVLPILEKRGLYASFFPPVAAVRGKMLPVHKIHFILASVGHANVIVDAIRPHMKGWTKGFDQYWDDNAIATRFDTPEIQFVKRMLQQALPDPFRTAIVNQLFARFVTTDESAFAAELYMSRAQLEMMVGLGHQIGNHGVNHEWMDTLLPDEQEAEIDESIAFLAGIGALSGRREWVMCYPYGQYNDSLLDIIRRKGAAIGLTSKVAVADLSSDHMLELPRLDTNDIPF